MGREHTSAPQPLAGPNMIRSVRGTAHRSPLYGKPFRPALGHVGQVRAASDAARRAKGWDRVTAEPNADFFEDYADVYAAAPYHAFAEGAAVGVRQVLNRMGVSANTLLDIACGTGVLAIAMANSVPTVVGIDQSSRMVTLAVERASRAGAAVAFHRMDMRSFDLERRFDVVTCTYNSLNYLLVPRDLDAVFDCVARSLLPGGVFIFDLHTPCYFEDIDGRAFVIQNDASIVEVWENRWQADRRRLESVATVFRLIDGSWQRLVERHHLRPWERSEVEDALARHGFDRPSAFADLAMAPCTDADKRQWLVCFRPGGRKPVSR